MSNNGVEELTKWLRKRGEPDSGINYRGRSYSLENGARDAYVELRGSDADFIVKQFHGKGARDLADALEALQRERDEARKVLTEFIDAATKDRSIQRNPAFESDDIAWLVDRALRALRSTKEPG